jgi:hypothetical protein
VVPSSATQGLWLAILQRAIQDLAIPPLSGEPCECGLEEDNGPHWFRCMYYWKAEAQDWFRVERSSKVGSFPFLCALLGIKVRRLRQLAFAWAAAQQEVARREPSPPARASVPNHRHEESRSENQP